MPREMIFEELVPTMFRLEPAQQKALRTAARAEKISDAELLRRLIDKYIIKNNTDAGEAKTISA